MFSFPFLPSSNNLPVFSPPPKCDWIPLVLCKKRQNSPVLIGSLHSVYITFDISVKTYLFTQQRPQTCTCLLQTLIWSLRSHSLISQKKYNCHSHWLLPNCHCFWHKFIDVCKVIFSRTKFPWHAKISPSGNSPPI